MAGPPRILIAGGYGTFGRLLARELLATTDARLVIAGRKLARAKAACRALNAGERAEPLALALADQERLARAARECFAVVCAAGPFQDLDPALPRVAVRAGAHWLDIADDPAWIGTLSRDEVLHATACDAGLAVLPGQSCVPALSGALARWCLDRMPPAHAAHPAHDALAAQVTLFIGNRNAKGAGAIASVLQAGLSQPAAVELPGGRRTAYRVGTPDATPFDEAGLTAEFHVAFEWEVAGRTVALASRVAGKLGPAGRRRLASALAALALPFGRLGSSIGWLEVVVRERHGGPTSAALLGEGQRMAVLPCALAAAALLGDELRRRGVVRPSEWLTPDEWVARLCACGVGFTAG